MAPRATKTLSADKPPIVPKIRKSAKSDGSEGSKGVSVGIRWTEKDDIALLSIWQDVAKPFYAQRHSNDKNINKGQGDGQLKRLMLDAR